MGRKTKSKSKGPKGARRSNEDTAPSFKIADNDGDGVDPPDEGFSSRPSSAASDRRPSSSSSSEEEVFWGAELKSSKCAEAERRLLVYEAKLDEGVLSKETTGDDPRLQWLEFKKDYGPLPSSSKYRKFNDAGNDDENDDRDDAYEGRTDAEAESYLAIAMASTKMDAPAAASNAASFLSPIDEKSDERSTEEEEEEEEAGSNGGSPIDLRTRKRSLVLQLPSETIANPRSVSDLRSTSPRCSLETVIEDVAETEEAKRGGNETSEEVFAATTTSPKDTAPVVMPVAVVENRTTSPVEEIVAASITLENPENDSPLIASSLLSVADASSDVPSPAFLVPSVATFNIPSSTPRSSYADVHVNDAAGEDGEEEGRPEDVGVSEDRVASRKSSLSALKDFVSREKEKIALKEELIALRELQRKMGMADLERLESGLEGGRDRCVGTVATSVEIPITGASPIAAVSLGASVVESDVISVASSSIAADATAESISCPNSGKGIVDQSPPHSEVLPGDVDERFVNDDAERIDRDSGVIPRSPNLDQSVNSTLNSTLNSTIFGMSCRAPQSSVDDRPSADASDAPADESSLTNDVVVAVSVATSPFASSPFATVGVASSKGVSHKPSPMKSPSLHPSVGSSSAIKRKATTPGRSVAWKQNMHTSPANSSPRNAAGLTPGKSLLKKSGTKTAPGTPPHMKLTLPTPSRDRRADGDGSPPLRAPGEAKNLTSPKTPSRSLFVRKSPGAIPKSPGGLSKSSGAVSKALSAVPKSPGAISRSPGTFLKAPGTYSKSPGVTSKSPVNRPAPVGGAPTTSRTPKSAVKSTGSSSMPAFVRSPAALASRGAMMARAPSAGLPGKSFAGVAVRSPGAVLAAGRSPGVPLKTNPATTNVPPPSSVSSKTKNVPRIPTPGSKFGVAASSSSAGKRPVATTSASNLPNGSKTLTPKSLSFK